MIQSGWALKAFQLACAQLGRVGLLLAGWGVASAHAQDPLRGAGLYLQLPAGVAACVSCHGPDPAGNRNNLLRAAGQPVVLLKALNAIGVMGYLKGALSDADISDLAAYLETVARAASDPTHSVWPRTVEFGALGFGTASPEHAVWLRNLSAAPLTGVMPQVVGGRFEARHNCPTVLAPGAACSVTLRALAPSPSALQSDALTWGSASPAVIGLVATGATGPVAVLSTSSVDLDLGAADVGLVVLRRLNLINAGTASATLGVHTFTGPTAGAFSTDGGCASGTVLMPGTACAVELRWRAGAPVAYEAALQWRSDGSNPAPLRLLAQGQAASAPIGPPVVPPAVTPAEPPAVPPTLPPSNPPQVDSAGGGGCTGSGMRADSGTTLWLAGAVVVLLVRRRRGSRSHSRRHR